MARTRSKKHGHGGSPETIARQREERARHSRRRRHSRFLLAGVTALVLFAAIGAVVYATTRSDRELHNLGAVGKGIPAVVQVHDTACPFCNELRANVRQLEQEFSEEDLLIRVADVDSITGLAFARTHTAQRRVTLLFFDGEGRLVAEQTGVQEVETLRRTFARHLRGEL
jgi:hypothetical protein